MSVSYTKEQRTHANETGRPLFTIDVPGLKVQGIGDQELVRDLIAAVVSFRGRQATNDPTTARPIVEPCLK